MKMTCLYGVYDDVSEIDFMVEINRLDGGNWYSMYESFR